MIIHFVAIGRTINEMSLGRRPVSVKLNTHMYLSFTPYIILLRVSITNVFNPHRMLMQSLSV